MDEELETQIILRNIDIFDYEEYIEECDIDFVVERALKIVKEEPYRISEIVEKVKNNSPYKHVEIYKAFDRRREEFFNYLCDENFLLNEENEKALLFLPHLYLKSLQNNYEYTINYKCYKYLPNYEVFNDIIIEDNDLLMEYYQTLTKNNYCVSDDVEHPLFVAPVMLLASLNTDRINTYAKSSFLFLFLSENVQRFIYEKGFKEFYAEKDSLLPQFIVEKTYVLNEILENKDQIELANRFFSREKYNSFNEMEVLKAFNVENSSIEEFVRELCDEKSLKTRRNLSFKEKLLLTFYGKKLAYQQGVGNCKIRLFSYTTNTFEGNEARGQLIGKDIYAFITQNDDSARDLLFTIVHEIMHARQNLAIETINFNLDSDIDIYSKEYLLGEIYNEKYYKGNYRYISYEQDANFKAEIKVGEILAEMDELFEYYKVLGKKELLKNSQYLNQISKKTKANFSLYRNFEGKTYLLDDLFEILASKYLRSGKNLNALFDKFPLLNYEYNIYTSQVVAKSMKELMYDFNNSIGEYKDIYLWLIKQKLDEKKTIKYLENRKEIKANLRYFSKETQKIFEEVLSKKYNRLRKYSDIRNF